MRVRHVMNKNGRVGGVEGLESADDQIPMAEQETGASMDQSAEIEDIEEVPAESNPIPPLDNQETTVDPPSHGAVPVKEENSEEQNTVVKKTAMKKPVPEVTEKKDFGSLVKDSFAILLHHPERWPALNKRLSKRRDVLFGVESVVKSKGLAPVREELQKVKPAIDADLIWSLHQPLLALIVFILHERNDIHRKLVRVPELKGDICRAMELGRPSKNALRGPAAPPKPKLERTAKTPKSYDEVWEEEKPKKRRLTGEKMGLKKRLSEGPSAKLDEPSGSPAASDEDDGNSSEEYVPGRSSTPNRTPAAKKPKIQDGMTLHQQIAAAQERDRSGKFAPGFSPGTTPKLKKVLKKPGSTKPGLLNLVKGFKKKAPKTGEKGADTPLGKRVPIKKVHSIDSHRFTARKQHTPKRAHPNDGTNGARASAAPAAAKRPRAEEEDTLRDEEVAELVCALRARGEREARALDAMGASELDERIEDLEATRKRAEAEIAQLKARKRALVGEDGGEAREKEIGAPLRAAREACLRAITDLLDLLPPNLQRVPLALFNELERTGDFDVTLGALARKTRAHLHRDWDRKNELAAQAKRAEMEATYQKNKVRRHLGIQPSSEEQTVEYDAVFGTFQQKLADLRGEMDRQVKLLDDAESSAKQAWDAYRAAA